MVILKKKGLQMAKIFPRVILKKIKPFLGTPDVIVILGARQTGKSTLLRLLMEQVENPVYFDLEDFKFREICNAGVESFVRFLKESGVLQEPRTFVFLDEIQLLEQPSSFLKLLHDHYPFLKLIVTGSSTFAIRKKFKDSLVGRTVTFVLYPLSFLEFLIFKEQSFDLTHEIGTPQLIDQLKQFFNEYVRFGGYPKIVLTEDKEMKEIYLRQIVDTYVRADIRDLANIRYIDKFNRLLRILAQQSGSLLNIHELSLTTGIAKPTLEDYLFILENTFVLKRLSPFSGNLRSELFKRQKPFFLDMGLMHILEFNSIPEVVLGPSFETAIFSELLKNFPDQSLFYWRTKDKKEIDFILDLNGQLNAIEVKLNSAQLKTKALTYFQNRYQANIYAVCLEISREFKSLPCLYPWQIYREFRSE